MVEEIIRTLELPELNPKKWENRIFNDNENFLKDLNFSYDDRGIIGDELFPLSLDNTHQEVIMAIRSLKVVSGQTVDKEIFSALCPELENFVSFVNWLGSIDSRDKKHLEYRKKIKSFLEDKEGNNLCIINGNYRISKENYARIIPFRGELNIINKNEEFSWEFAPYLKRTSETFLAYPSPIFTSPINDLSLNNKSTKEKKLFCFTAPFILRYSELNELCIRIISATSPIPCEIKIKTELNREKIDRLMKNGGEIFLGLFANIIEENKKWDIYLINFSKNKLSGESLLAHLLITRLYYNYLLNMDSLLITNILSLKRKINLIISQIKRTYSLDMEYIVFEEFYKKYLSYFFKIHKNKLYYIPYCLRSQCNKLDEFIEYLEKLSLVDKTKGNAWIIEIGISNVRRFERALRIIQFIKQYNSFSKRNLIDLIKTHRRKKDNSWKWQI